MEEFLPVLDTEHFLLREAHSLGNMINFKGIQGLESKLRQDVRFRGAMRPVSVVRGPHPHHALERKPWRVADAYCGPN